METTIYIITYVITALAALVLIGIAVSLVRRKDSSRATLTAVLSSGFLVLLLLNMSKFKHVKGFGFDAETWDEKQIKAADLVDKLSSTSDALNQQVALLASRLGIWGPGLTNPELIDLLQQMRKQLNAASISKTRIDEITAPIRRRIAMDYWFKAQTNLSAIYWQQIIQLKKEGQTEKADDLLKAKNESMRMQSHLKRLTP